MYFLIGASCTACPISHRECYDELCARTSLDPVTPFADAPDGLLSVSNPHEYTRTRRGDMLILQWENNGESEGGEPAERKTRILYRTGAEGEGDVDLRPEVTVLG